MKYYKYMMHIPPKAISVLTVTKLHTEKNVLLITKLMIIESGKLLLS